MDHSIQTANSNLSRYNSISSVRTGDCSICLLEGDGDCSTICFNTSGDNDDDPVCFIISGNQDETGSVCIISRENILFFVFFIIIFFILLLLFIICCFILS